MSDEPITPAAQVDATTAQAPVTPEPVSQEPKFLTLEQAETWKNEILNQAKSYSDKGRIALKKQVDAVEATIKNAEKFGAPIPPEVQASMREKARQVAENEPLEDEPVLPELTPEQSQKVSQELYAHDLKMQGKFDVPEFEQNDPEIKLIKVTGNIAADKASIEAAYLAKKNRLSSTTQTPIVEAPVSAGVRVGGNIGTKPNVERTGKGYLEEAFK